MYKSINIKILQISKNLQILQMNGNLSWMRSQIEMKYPGYSVLVPAHWAQYEQVFVCYFPIYFLRPWAHAYDDAHLGWFLSGLGAVLGGLGEVLGRSSHQHGLKSPKNIEK